MKYSIGDTVQRQFNLINGENRVEEKSSGKHFVIIGKHPGYLCWQDNIMGLSILNNEYMISTRMVLTEKINKCFKLYQTT